MEMQTEYISDGNYNYLRINYGEEEKSSYSYRMIMENTIKGLLPCRVRMVNGNTYLYYEVQSKQTLECRYEIKEIDYEALRNLFYYLYKLGKELEKYLLDMGNIVFNEKYIFQDVETGETGFLFLPNKGTENSYAEFMEYVVKRIDHRDMKAVHTSYRLYDLSRKEHVSVEEIWALFENEENGKQERKRIEGSVLVTKYEEKGKYGEKEEGVKVINEQIKTQSEKNVEWKDFIEDEKEEIQRQKWKDIFISSLLVIIFTALLCVKISIRLSYEEETILLAGMAVDIVLFFVHIYCKFRKQKVKETLGHKAPSTIDLESGRADMEYKNERAELENVDFNEVADMEIRNKNLDHTLAEVCTVCDRESNIYGATVFLEPESENILYGLGKFEKTVIKMDKFPFTIGKIKEEADYVLKDSSISRLHARFYQDNKEVYIMDLNSTNGTCKNGFRIPANQKILLEEGDELTFGKIRFYYR